MSQTLKQCFHLTCRLKSRPTSSAKAGFRQREAFLLSRTGSCFSFHQQYVMKQRRDVRCPHLYMEPGRYLHAVLVTAGKRDMLLFQYCSALSFLGMRELTQIAMHLQECRKVYHYVCLINYQQSGHYNIILLPLRTLLNFALSK